jgi:hypothetical protein
LRCKILCGDLTWIKSIRKIKQREVDGWLAVLKRRTREQEVFPGVSNFVQS